MNEKRLRVFATWLKDYDEYRDPYYGGDYGFQDVYDMVDEACDRIVEKIG